MRLRKLVSSILPAGSLLPSQLLCVHEARALLGAHVPRNWYILQTRTSEELRPQPNSPQGTECHQQPCELGSRSIPSQASDKTPALLVTPGWQPMRPWADPAELSPESWLQKQMCVVSSHCICDGFLRSREQLIQIIKRHIHWEPNHLTLSTSILPVLCRQAFPAKGHSHRTCLIGFPEVLVPQKGRTSQQHLPVKITVEPLAPKYWEPTLLWQRWLTLPNQCESCGLIFFSRRRYNREEGWPSFRSWPHQSFT